MKLSVALCTYNGALYLEEQLQSIATQHRVPDELVVCDDGSTDGTVAILHAFAKSVSFPVRITENQTNLGVTKNFEQAIRLCQGDIIALSDQDDIWYPQKLASAMDVFHASPQVGLIFSDADVMDETLKAMGYRLWQQVGVNTVKQRHFHEGRGLHILLQQHVVTGATMAFRADFKPLILPILPNWFHDSWIALVVTAVSQACLFDAPMMGYRQHRLNQIGARQRNFKQKLQKLLHTKRSSHQQELARFIAATERLRAFIQEHELPGILTLFAGKTRHLQMRANLPKNCLSRFPFIAWGLITGRYHRFSRGFYSAAMDLFLEG